MKKCFFATLLLLSLVSVAQEVTNDSINPNSIQSLKESLDEHKMKFESIDEKLSKMDSDLGKLNKIKFSGYIQAQYEQYDFTGPLGHGIDVNKNGVLVNNTFSIRRARVKLTYESSYGATFVIQPDYAFDKVTLRDAYVQLNDRWLSTFKLFMGHFNRTSYEVEFSSRSRELVERSRMSPILYPQERDLGAKLEVDLLTKYEIPFKFQLAVFNGNYGLGTLTNDLKDVDSKKDVMMRGVYSFSFPNQGLGVDLGAHAYLGNTAVLKDGKFLDTNNNTFTAKLGESFQKRWFGGEARVYYDFLGGMSLKGEYISGLISGEKGTDLAPIANSNTGFNFNGLRDFTGFYTTFVKNIGKNHQFALRYDSWDPNRHLSGDEVTIKDDLQYKTWAFSWQYFYDDNIKIVAGYTMPINESSTKVSGFDKDVKDNTFTLRIQAGF
jgi:hypothetical protein